MLKTEIDGLKTLGFSDSEILETVYDAKDIAEAAEWMTAEIIKQTHFNDCVRLARLSEIYANVMEALDECA